MPRIAVKQARLGRAALPQELQPELATLVSNPR